MAEFGLTLEGLDGARERLEYDSFHSRLTRAGERVDLSHVGRAYVEGVEFSEIPRVSPERPGRKSSAPVRLKIQLGLGCNYSCSYCSQASHKPEDAGTATRDIEAFLEKMDAALTAPPKRIELWGGEPLLYWKKLLRLVPALRRRYPDARLSMVTNGALLDDRKVDFIKEHQIRVAISHDGPGQDLRGPDPFDDLEWVSVARRLYDEHGFGFLAVITRRSLDPAETVRWLRKKLERPVRVNLEGVVDAHSTEQALTPEERSLVAARLFSQLVGGDLHEVDSLQAKLENFYDSLAYAVPALRTGQKCQMDDEAHLAVDLAGNVLTCQNVGANGPHGIGRLDDLPGVRLDTSWHWSQRKECRTCPVVQLCHGACMFLEGPAHADTCANEYALNYGVFMAALFFLTGKVLVSVEPRTSANNALTRQRVTIPIIARSS